MPNMKAGTTPCESPNNDPFPSMFATLPETRHVKEKLRRTPIRTDTFYPLGQSCQEGDIEGFLGGLTVDKFGKTPSFPRKAGIQMRDMNPIFLDSRLRGSDGKTERVDGLFGWGRFRW